MSHSPCCVTLAYLQCALAAAEIIPGMKAPPPTSQEPLVQDPSGESLDESFNDSSPESRRHSNKHASSSGSSGTTPSSSGTTSSSSSTQSSSSGTPSSRGISTQRGTNGDGTSNDRQSPDSTTQSSLSGNGSGKGVEDRDSSAAEQQRSGAGNGDGGGDGGTSMNGGLGAEQAKQAVSIAGNKMQQAAQSEGVNIASRSVHDQHILLLPTGLVSC